MPDEAAVSATSDEEKSSDAIATAKPVSNTSSEKSRDHAVDEPRECTALMIEQRGEGRGDAAAPPPPPSSTCDCLRQLWLLTRKNFILTRRNKLWTFFELVLPIIFMLPIAILIARSDKVALTPALVFKPVPLKGSAEDVTLNLPAYSSAPTIWDEWCNRLSVPIAYVARKNQDDVEKVITKLTERYSSSDITIDWVKMDKEEDMLNRLREDAANITDQHCGINKTSESNGMIRTHIRTYFGLGIDKRDTVSPGFMGDTMGVALILSLAFITSPIVIFLVEERVSKFLHQQSLTGVSPILFWAVSLFSDLILYSLICACFVVVFATFGVLQGYLEFLIVLLALYFWSCVFFIYLVSFIFSSPSRANVFLFIWQLVTAFGAFELISGVRMETKGEPWIEDVRV
ncbi:hypothetical protein GCK32_012018 [Trichostrongylus colubriformis]|uniref:ABC-2 type transporter transmembrane domain-containing protein n=1 Tax=Trichostrongylus colubriformis TaxID=6319 RepID=A0AAN8EZF4_TRICO